MHALYSRDTVDLMIRGGINIFTKLRQLPRITKAAFAERRFRRELRAVPRSSIADLPGDTHGRIAGIAKPFERVLEAPLSGRRCVYYRILIASFDAGYLRELATEQDAVRFVLEDRGHRAVIDPTHATFSTGFDHESTSRAATDADIMQLTLLERHALASHSFFGIDALLYREAIVGVGERITVVGAGTREPDPDAMPMGSYREHAVTRLWLRGSARFPLVISDDPEDL
jgi:hypothetical protein